MQLKSAQIVGACGIGRAKFLTWRMWPIRVFGDNLRIAMSSIMRRRNGLMTSLVMGDAPV
jgi:hypothetical protein